MVGGFEDRYFLSFVRVLSFVDLNTLFQRGYFYVGLWGAGWYFLPENPTFFVRRNRKIPHRKNSHPSRHCTSLPPAALASLFMATSAMDPNHGAAAPYESNVGSRHQGPRLLRLIPLFGAPKWHPSKIWEKGGAPGLGGRHSMMIRNNQPNDGVGSGRGMGEETRPGGTCERGRLPIV